MSCPCCDYVIYAPNADHTFQGYPHNRIVAQSGIVTASRIFKLGDTLVGDGYHMELVNHTAFNMAIQTASGGALGTLPALSGSTPGYMKVGFHNDGAAPRWQVMFTLP